MNVSVRGTQVNSVNKVGVFSFTYAMLIQWMFNMKIISQTPKISLQENNRSTNCASKTTDKPIWSDCPKFDALEQTSVIVWNNFKPEQFYL